MTKSEFIKALKKNLSGLPKEEIEGRIAFYEEMIDDRIEEGLSEEDAVESLGAVDEIAEQILSEIPLKKLVKEKVRSRRRLTTLEIVLIIFGFPIWLTLALLLLSVAFVLFVAFWAIVIALFAAEIALSVSAVGVLIAGIVMLCKGSALSGFALIGCAMVCFGLFILLAVANKYVAKAAILVMKKIWLAIKSAFRNKEEEGI